MSDIEFIYFDLGKVILPFDHNIAYRQVAEVAGVPETVCREFVAESDLQNRFETGLIDDSQYHAEFCAGTDSSPTNDELLLAISDMFEVNRRIVPVLSQLKAVGVPMGILSNTCPAHWQFVCGRYAFLRQLFNPMILSYEVKSMKPDAEIYRQAIEAANVPAEHIFFTDDRQENVDGALAAGIDACLFTSVDNLMEELGQRGIRINL